MKNQTDPKNRSYRVLGTGNGIGGYSDHSIAPRNPSELFTTIKDTGDHPRVLLFMDQDTIDTDRFGLALAFTLADIGYRVAITTNPDPELAGQVDIVVTRNVEYNGKLNRKLKQYDDGTRIIYTDSRQRKEFSGKGLGQVVKMINEEIASLKI